MKKFFLAAIAAALGAILFANQYESLDPIEIDGVFAQVRAGENSRAKRQFLQIFYDPKADLLEFSAKCRETGWFCAVLPAESRQALADFSKGGVPCDFSWGKFKISSSEGGVFWAKDSDEGKILEFSCKNFAKKFQISFFQEDFDDFLFKISERNLQSLCDDALNDLANDDEGKE